VKKFLKSFLPVTFFLCSTFISQAKHIVGGDLSVKWVKSDTFEVVLNFFRDCKPGNTSFEKDIKVGLYVRGKDSLQQEIIITGFDSTFITLGDACYDPKMCILKGTYRRIIKIPDNSAGYYMSYNRCCRNTDITNLAFPDQTGYVLYCEIPKSGLKNSSPTFNKTQDGYMCLNYPNLDDFACTDIDGDSLVYSFVTPLSCSASSNQICTQIGTPGPDPGIGAGPYGDITWASGYGSANAMGDPNMSIDAKTGMVKTTPLLAGVFVFCVKVEEYRNKVKIGEVRRDFQFKTLGCWNLYSSFNPSPEVCAGKAATLTAEGPPSGFTYSWAPGGQISSTIVVTPTSSGTFNYTVTATNGACSSKATAVVTVNPNPTASTVLPYNIRCFGGNGYAEVSPLGGTSPYSYSWKTAPVQTTQMATGLLPGTYTVVVKDANTCTSTETVTITQPTLLTSSGISKINVSCFSGANGTATVTPTGGTPGYTYLWNTLPAQTNNVAAGLSANKVYSITITDANACTSTSTITLTEPPLLVSSIASSVMPLCFGSNNGSASIAANGGTPTYTYSWNTTPAQSTTLATGLSAGNYSVLITDAQGCTSSKTVTIAQPAAVVGSASFSGFSCAGTSPNGSVMIAPNGGTPPYSYLWMPGMQTSTSVSNLIAGTYSIVVTDKNNCSFTTSATITPSTKPHAIFSYTPSVSCNGMVIIFKDESTPSLGITDWLWDFGNGKTSTQQHPNSLYNYGAGNKMVSLIVHQAPCYDTLKLAINVKDLYDYATIDDKTNIFSPNGDLHNECFNPVLGGVGAESFKNCLSLEVYDRWGVQMFKSVGADNCWNGINQQNNQQVSDGVYYYIANLYNKTIRGSVTVVRGKK
jgi:gliding motility-associated-like protein